MLELYFFILTSNLNPIFFFWEIFALITDGVSSVGSMVAGMLTGQKNRTFPVLVVASCLMVIGTACLSTLSDEIDVEAKTYGFQVFMGLGFGLTVATSSIVSLKSIV